MKNEMQEVFEIIKVLTTKNGGVYGYDETGKVEKLEPLVEVGGLELYEFDYKNFVMVKDENNQRCLVEDSAKSKQAQQCKYKILGNEDLVFGYEGYQDYGYVKEDSWYVISKQKDGKYKDITNQFGYRSLEHIGVVGGSLWVGGNRFVKKEGEYIDYRIIEKEQKELETAKNAEELRAWQPVSNLGKELEMKLNQSLLAIKNNNNRAK